MDSAKKYVQDRFNSADIIINGNRPFDIQVKDERFYNRILLNGALGLGEAYMDSWWDCPQLDEFINRLLKITPNEKTRKFKEFGLIIKAVISNMLSGVKSSESVNKHYDLGNELFKNTLDKRMLYTCGYWKDADNLDDAQEAKLDLICRKLNLKPGQNILDIGCGWGSFEKFASERYEVNVVGISKSKKQIEYAQSLCKGLPVEIRFQDYKEINEQFDHILVMGMIENIGSKNFRNFMKVVSNNLNPEGLFLLHTIGSRKSSRSTDPWFDKYIFPNGVLPSEKQISTATEGIFVLEDWHNFGSDYDKTLMEWHKNFIGNWESIKDSYDERFYRMWTYYLLSAAGGFRSRKNQLWQIVFSKNGVPGGYESVR